MSTQYHANPVVAKKSVRPGESLEYVGTRNTTELLPAIFQTTINKKFLDTTLEQLMSTGSMEAINYFTGTSNNRKVSESYLKDNRLTDSYQFVPGSVVRNDSNEITQAMSYDDFLDILKYNEVDVGNTNRIFNEPGYTLDLPINYDMFVNYHHYYWLVDFLPVCDIIPTVTNPIAISDIVGSVYYTTPTLSNGKTLELQDGMRVRFSGSNATGTATYPTNDIYIVDGVGTSISFTKQFEYTGTGYGKRVWFNDTVYGSQEPSQWEGSESNFVYPTYDLTEYEVYGREYTVEQRHTRDQSAWSRKNLWIHEEAAIAVCVYNDLDLTDFLLDKFRGIRPIIEFRANIEKFNFATQSLGSITHVYDNVDDPASSIIGNNFDLVSYTVTTNWSNVGYDFGDHVKVVSNGVTSFWNCIKSHTQALNPTYSENREYWVEIQSRDIVDGDTILFLNSTNPVYNNRIFTASVSGNGQVTALTELYGASSTPLVTGDGIKVRIGYNNVFGESYPNDIYSGSEWHWNGTSWVYSQQKDTRNDSIMFQLYDINSVKLDNETLYPNNNFQGDFIFKYGTSETTKVDNALGIQPRYVDYGNEPGLSFDLGLGSVRYEYNARNTTDDPENTNASIISEILGYYYYKRLDNSQYYNGWVEVRESQPVWKHAQKIVTDATKPVLFNLGTDKLLSDETIKITKRNNKLEFYEGSYSHITRVNGLNPILFFDKTKEYIVTTYFDSTDIEFVNVDGSALSGVTVGTATNNVFTIVVGNSFVPDVFRYRLVSDNTVTGLIYVNESQPSYIDNDYVDPGFVQNQNSVNVVVKINGTETTNYALREKQVIISNGHSVDDVIDVTWYTDDKITDSDGVDLPADTHILNPQNELLTQVSFGDILSHIKEQMTGYPGLTGNFFGINNYRNLPRVHEFGGTIRQQPYSTELLAQLVMHNDTNIFSSLKHAANSYGSFKKQFLQKCIQLHNTMDSSKSVYEVVDEALKSITIGKTANDVFANSNMLKFSDYEEFNGYWTATLTPVFDIPQTVNTYDDTKNHVNVYVRDDDGSGNLRWRNLIKDVDYTITENQVTVTTSVTYDSSGQALIKIRWYPLTSSSFVPPSAVKLGLLNASPPALNAKHLFGHDGSISIRKGSELYNRNSANFNIEDAVLWEFETRIYNNLIASQVVDYKKIMPNAHRPTVYNWADLTEALRTDFNKWKLRNNISTLHDASSYDASDEFTYNYSDVGPGIGGWRGLYTYYFNTDRPHSNPWEMLGHNTQPSWWDTYYSWTDPTKRAAFIAALKVGHYNDPSQVPEYDLAYAYTAYDWDNNNIVDNAGLLIGPVTAGVITTPTNPAKEFVFGDWGDIEDAWRRSSEYKISLFTALTKLRPLRIVNDYFRSNTRTEYNFNTRQVAFTDTRQLGNNRNLVLTNESYENSIVESVSVKTGGTGYTSAPSLSLYSNFGTGATLLAKISNGVVVAASVTNPGSGYQTKPSIVPSTGSATFDVVLANDVKKYVDGLSNAIINYSQRNGTTALTLKNRLENYTNNPIIKTGGFVNSNQTLILESSQDKGRVVVPEEDITTVLYTSQPKEEVFFGAVKVTKLSTGYRVAGYDNAKQYFSYFKPNQSAGKIVVNVGNKQVYRYKNFESTATVLDYNTVLTGDQALYEFLLGYGEYLNSQGWNATWRSTAGNTILWTETAKVDDIYYATPSTSRIEIDETKNGYFSNVANKFDGEYNVINQNGYQILNNRLTITRDVISSENGKTIVEARDDTAIYGLRLYRVEVEHAFVVNNSTNFDDMIYDPVLGIRHSRVIWRGSRTKNWNGKFYAPGFIINGNGVIANFDTVANEIGNYYGPGNVLSNQQQVDTARFNIGYNKPLWNEVAGLDDDTLFKFIKGTRKYKGTRHALNAFMRNTSLFGTLASAKVHEEWAIRTADYGDTRSRDTLEFEINKELLKTNPQPVRFSATELNDVLSDIVIDVDFNSPLLVTGTPGNNFQTRWAKTFNYTTISEESVYANDLISAGLPLLTETDYRVLNKEDFAYFPEEVKDDYSFEGEWQTIEHWDNKTAYKFKDKVIYQGKVWEMLDPDGTSGLTRPNDIITATGTVSLPVIPASDPNETLVIDGNTIVIQRSTNSDTFNPIIVDGTQDILSNDVVTDNSTIVLGTTSSTAISVTFDTTTSTTVYNNAQIQGNVTNPIIAGGASKELIIESTSVLFDEVTSGTQNITMQAAFENAFSLASYPQPTNLAQARITALEELRSTYGSAKFFTYKGYFMSTFQTTGTGFTPTQTGAQTVDIACPTDAFDLYVDGVYQSTLTRPSGVYTYTTNFTANDNVSTQLLEFVHPSTGTTSPATASINIVYSFSFQDPNFAWQGLQNPVRSWDLFMFDYFGESHAGFDLPLLLTEYNTSPSYTTELEALISSDLALINEQTNTGYVLQDVLDGIQTVSNADISATRSAVEVGQYITDTKTFITINPTTAITNTTIVTTTTSSGFKQYSLSDIVDKINQASIPNITASANNSRLLITKTTNTPSIEFTLTISVASANAEAGFETSGPTIVTSPGNVVTVSPNLTLQQVIDQINAAQISGISASRGGTNSNLLRITSTNQTLYIGAGTANSAIGLSVGSTTAPTTTTTIKTNVDLSSIIDIINAAALPGITASNSNNRLRLTSTNSTLVIGAGTANTKIGLTAQTLSATQTEIANVFNAFVGSDGNQIFQEMENDPNVFSIWVADNKDSDVGSGSGYNVYQTMDFGMYITRACAGINDADDAQITIALADSNVQAHNLSEGDYVFITGSNTVPSIDGVHKVTTVDVNNITFYIDEYIQEEGNVGNVYPLRSVRFADYTTLINNYDSQTNGVFNYNFAGLRQNNQQTPKLAFVDDDGTGAPAVYKFNGSFTNNTGHTGSGWFKLRTSPRQARNDLLESVKLYDATSRSLITQLEVYDPAKGIIPGFIDEEIDLILTTDLASYNYNTLDGFSENTKAWTSDKVGVRWWDINNAIYVDYEQGSIDYKQAYWGRLFDGASIDVYEWTRSSVLPEEWTALVERGGYVDGKPASGEPLSVTIEEETVYQWVEENWYNPRNKRTETSYYFWVKNKLNSFGQRNYNTYQLARLLENPTAFDISWCAACSSQELIVANIEQYVTNNSVVQVNQRYESNALPMSEWTLLAENDPVSIIPEQLHIKMRDSLTGYNRHAETYLWTYWNAATVYPANKVVETSNGNFYISVAENTNVDPDTDTSMSYWNRIYDYSFIDGTPQQDISISRPHALPDLDLHPYNRYGHLTRPRQSLVRELPIARQNFVETVNKLLAEMNLIEEVTDWDTVLTSTYVEGVITYNINNYWSYIDYVRGSYNTSIPTKYTVRTKDEIIGQLGILFPYVNGDTVLVTDVMHNDGINRPEIYSRINDEWVLEYKEKSTIKLSEELWNNEKFGLGYDLSGFDTDGFDNSVDGALTRIFDDLRNRIFTGKHKVKYNQLWFKLLYQAVADNTVDDFAFKTTFVKLNVEHALQTAREKYMGYKINIIEDFFNSIKPFHTKLHSVVDSNTHIESFETEIQELDRDAVITLRYNDHSSREFDSWAGDLAVDGGTFTEEPTHIDQNGFTTDQDNDIEYIYDGNVFIQPVEEGWGSEVYPLDVMENLRIRVQTNPSGSTVDNTNTRTFQMNIYEQYNIEESIALPQTSVAVTASTIAVNATTISLVDASMMTVPSDGVLGVAWIGTERVTYGAIDGNNLVYVTRGTYSTPPQEHAGGVNVRDASSPLRVPSLSEFGHYGDNLRLAYNDSGVSLAANGTTPEHEFIRNAGFGTL